MTSADSTLRMFRVDSLVTPALTVIAPWHLLILHPMASFLLPAAEAENSSKQQQQRQQQSCDN